MLERLYARNGLDEYHARMMIRAQMPLEEKCRRAAVVIKNEKGLEDLYQAVDSALEARKPSKLIHTVGLWIAPITAGIAVSSFLAFKLYSRLSGNKN